MKNKKGFTLMEMMVVVLIIAGLSAIAYPTYTRVITKARVSEALSLAEIVREAQQRYLVVNGTGAYFPEFTDDHISGRTRLIKSGGVSVSNGKLTKGDYTVSISGDDNECIEVSYRNSTFKITTHVEDSKIWCEEVEGVTGICNTIPSLETGTPDCGD